MPRGGKRSGRPATAYQNRSDLTKNKPLPIQAATGQPYGERKAQMDAQRAVPVAPPPAPAPVAAAPGAGAGAPPGLFDPTGRPDEPLTHGSAMGPGPGPESLLANRPPPNPLLQGLAALQNLGETADSDTKRLISQLQATLGNQSAP